MLMFMFMFMLVFVFMLMFVFMFMFMFMFMLVFMLMFVFMVMMPVHMPVLFLTVHGYGDMRARYAAFYRAFLFELHAGYAD